MRNGLAATGKTITAAALIMILVFGSFILGGSRVIKEFGLGLAGGILVDAVIIRMAVVPSVMLLLGKVNWWFPWWLQRLPRVNVDPDRPGRAAHRHPTTAGRRGDPSPSPSRLSGGRSSAVQPGRPTVAGGRFALPDRSTTGGPPCPSSS